MCHSQFYKVIDKEFSLKLILLNVLEIERVAGIGNINTSLIGKFIADVITEIHILKIDLA